MDRYSEHAARPTLSTPERKDDEFSPPPPASNSNRRRTYEDRRGNDGKKYIKRVLLGVAVLAVLLGALWVFVYRGGMPSYIDTSKYQGVFLQSGEQYFGRVQSVSDDTIVLTDVFYVQKSAQAATDKTTGTSLELIKLGNEVHGPEDKMIINRSQVVYIENLTSEGQVAQKITEYHNNQKK